MPPRAKKAKTGASTTSQLSLQLTPEPPEFPFVGSFFEMPVFLVDGSGNPRTSMVVPLAVTLLDADTDEPSALKDLLVLDPDAGAPAIGMQGQAKIRLKMTDVSMHHNNKRFALRVAPAGAEHAKSVLSAKTRPMTVIQHKIEILDQPPELWYKDEGGRDKCISLRLRMIDAAGACVCGRTVPLKVELIYEGGGLVLNQQLLKIPPDSKRYIDTGTGLALLRLRIEDVSKNHQGQSFCIRVSPDTGKAPMNHDISSDRTSAISVRSKRNKSLGAMKASGGNPNVAAAWNAGVNKPSGMPLREASLGAPPPSGPSLGLTRSMDEAIKGLPELLRGGSFGFGMDFGGGGAMSRNNSMGVSAPPALGRGVSGNWLTRMSAQGDHDVFFVIARVFKGPAPLGELGLPAFDKEHALLGFYQEGQSDAATEVLFMPLVDLPALTDCSKDAAKALLGSELEAKSDAVFRLDRHNNDLVKLKEDALMFYWTSNLGEKSIQDEM